MPPQQFAERIDELITTLKSSRSAPGQEILVPGELENRAVTAAAGTVTLPARTVEELSALAAACGLGALSREL